MSDKKVNKVMTPPFRMSFPNLLEPKAFSPDQKAKYSVSAVFYPSKFTDQDRQTWKALLAAVDQESVGRFGKPSKQLPKHIRQPFHPNEDKEHLDGYDPGGYFVNLSSQYKPAVVDTGGNDVISPDEIYAGRWARATVTVYSYANSFGKGLMLGLANVQLLKHDSRLDGRTDGASDFANTSVDEAWLDSIDDPTEGFDDDIPF